MKVFLRDHIIKTPTEAWTSHMCKCVTHCRLTLFSILTNVSGSKFTIPQKCWGLLLELNAFLLGKPPVFLFLYFH